jgi:hypothetical protein
VAKLHVLVLHDYLAATGRRTTSRAKSLPKPRWGWTGGEVKFGYAKAVFTEEYLAKTAGVN